MHVPFYAGPALAHVLDTPTLVERLREAFMQQVEAPLRHAHAVGAQNRLLLMPAWRTGEAIGVKLVTVFPENPGRGVPTVSALYVLLAGDTGRPLAILDGEMLTLARTGAASALTARYLARSDARTLLIVGTGQLAPFLARAYCATRRIDRILVWGRRRERATSLAARLADEALPACASMDLDAALAQADIVSCATTATAPILRGACVRPGTHVDLVGGFTRVMREADDELIARATIFVDTRAGALAEAGDLTQPLERHVIDERAVVAELADLVRGHHPGRTAPEEITLFKSVGTAIEDLAAALLALERLSKEEGDHADLERRSRSGE